MRIFVAGATGVVGKLLVPLLMKSGHEVIGATRTPQGATALREQGARSVELDFFDAPAVLRAVAQAAPDVVVHQLTDLSGGDFAANSRLRSVGTRHLVDAAAAAGVRRIVAQSVSWAYEAGEGLAAEPVPLDLGDLARAGMVRGVADLESAVSELPEWVVLRYGRLYGPGTFYAPGGAEAARIAAGTLRADEGVTNFLHLRDAARAAVAALEWPSGPVNVVDDEPAAGHAWVPVLAGLVGGPPPEVVVGRAGWDRGADGTKARRELGFGLEVPSWRAGFREGFAVV